MKTPIIIAVGLLLLATSCKNQKEQYHNAIKPPFAGVTIPLKSYKINASEETVIHTTRGTQITVPAGSLTDANGNPVRGNVNLRFREFHDAAEILVSGIPMRYDSSGVKYDFISAGMFEITAEQQGKQLRIGKGKTIDIALASFKSDEGYSFYNLNTETGGWSNLGIRVAEPNKQKATELKQFKDNNLIVFDIDYSTHPELQPFHGINWTYTGNDKTKNPLTNKWILQERWREIALSERNEKGTYIITLSNRHKRIELEMTPYFTEDQQQQLSDFAVQVENYQALVSEQKALESKIQLQADLTRSFAVSEFGFYNWDKISKLAEEQQLSVVNASFSIDGKPVEEVSQIYFINGKDQLLSRETKVWEKLVFQPKENNRLLLVLPDNRVALGNAAEFRKAKDKNEAVFHLTTIPKRIESLNDIQEILQKS